MLETAAEEWLRCSQVLTVAEQEEKQDMDIENQQTFQNLAVYVRPMAGRLPNLCLAAGRVVVPNTSHIVVACRIPPAAWS